MKYVEAKEKFISAWGTLGSSWGINRTMAQIHALLMISPAALSTEDIMEDLKISRGNANMNLRALMDWGLVNKEFKAGERREYFSGRKDIVELAKQVARERKKRELEPVLSILSELQEIEGDTMEVREFESRMKELQDFAKQADTMLDMFVNSRQNWLLKAVIKLNS